MASSNRHWPSMFKKSKTSTNPHGINSSLMSTGFQRTPYYTSAAGGGDERNPEPKPRWNPKPEQIRILEAIFNSGMVNPPRDEIRKIRTQLQEYGQVGDANVFYWFQNRKSRSKHKLRHLQKNKNNTDQAQQNPSSSLPQITPPSSSSSSSDKSSPQEIILPHKLGFFSDVNNIGVPNSNSPTASVNQAYFQTPNETNFQLPPPAEPFSFPMQHNGVNVMTTQGFYLSEFSNMIQPQQNVVLPSLPCTTSVLLSEIMSYGTTSNKDENQDKAINNIMHHQHQDPQLSFCLNSTSTDPTPVPPPITNTPPVTVPSPVTQLQGVGEEDGTAKCTVFINDVAFEVPVGPFNVREAFGDGAVLFHSSGHPVLTDEWGVTLQSLQHGASYYYLI